MNCLEFRRQVLTDLRQLSEEAQQHSLSCSSCQHFCDESKVFDNHLKQIMDVPMPEGLAAKILLNQSLDEYHQQQDHSWPISRLLNRLQQALMSLISPQWLALAASFAFVTFMSYQLIFTSTLADQITYHVENEINSLYLTQTIPVESLINVLTAANLTLATNKQKITDMLTYATICYIDGKMIAHFVVNTNDGPATILLMPYISIANSVDIDHRQWKGNIIPYLSGSMALIANNRTVLNGVEAAVRASISQTEAI